MALRISDEGPVRIDEVADRAQLSASEIERERMRAGFGLAWGVIGLIIVALIFVGIVALATYPQANDVHASLERCCEARSLYGLRGDWFSEIKDLLQLLVVSLLVPLLATLIGYLFGRQIGNREED